MAAPRVAQRDDHLVDRRVDLWAVWTAMKLAAAMDEWRAGWSVDYWAAQTVHAWAEMMVS